MIKKMLRLTAVLLTLVCLFTAAECGRSVRHGAPKPGPGSRNAPPGVDYPVPPFKPGPKERAGNTDPPNKPTPSATDTATPNPTPTEDPGEFGGAAAAERPEDTATPAPEPLDAADSPSQDLQKQKVNHYKAMAAVFLLLSIAFGALFIIANRKQRINEAGRPARREAQEGGADHGAQG